MISNSLDSISSNLFFGMGADDAKATVKELTESRDLEFEYHHVTTEDGYILEMHRAFKKIPEDSQTKRPVIFL
jgi:lysosomal acid lipase/cholesteryl ester hydrolase